MREIEAIVRVKEDLANPRWIGEGRYSLSYNTETLQEAEARAIKDAIWKFKLEFEVPEDVELEVELYDSPLWR